MALITVYQITTAQNTNKQYKELAVVNSLKSAKEFIDGFIESEKNKWSKPERKSWNMTYMEYGGGAWIQVTTPKFFKQLAKNN